MKPHFASRDYYNRWDNHRFIRGVTASFDTVGNVVAELVLVPRECLCLGVFDKLLRSCPSTSWADAGGGSCTDTPRGDTCWRSVGPHGECGFDAGGLPARFPPTPPFLGGGV